MPALNTGTKTFKSSRTTETYKGRDAVRLKVQWIFQNTLDKGIEYFARKWFILNICC